MHIIDALPRSPRKHSEHTMRGDMRAQRARCRLRAPSKFQAGTYQHPHRERVPAQSKIGANEPMNVVKMPGSLKRRLLSSALSAPISSSCSAKLKMSRFCLRRP
eukprot:474570-Prymnesium_polylepis.1